MSTNAATDWKALHGDHFSGCRALVTGGAGFIGSHLCHALLQLGASVTVLDDLSGGTRDNLPEASALQFVRASILDRKILSDCTRGRKYVFHLAALGSVPRSVEQPLRYQEVNTHGTLNVLEAAREAGAQRVMFSASSSAYGLNPVPWIESMPVLPRSPYAATKVAGEALMRAYSLCYPLDTVSLRYFNIFGPRQNANSAYAAVIAAFAKALHSDQRPIIYGDGEQSRDFTFVDNAVHANLLAARHAQPLCGEVINVGCGTQISVTRLAHLMAAGFNRPTLTPVYEPDRPGDIKHSFADLQRACSILNYAPIVPFTAGLEITMAWYKQALG